MIVVGAVCASEVLVAVVHVMLPQLAVELRLTLSVSDVTGGTSVLVASEVEALSALDVVRVVAESVLVSEVYELLASDVEALSALDVVKVVAEYVLVSEV